jgi:hypothetical protein
MDQWHRATQIKLAQGSLYFLALGLTAIITVSVLIGWFFVKERDPRHFYTKAVELSAYRAIHDFHLVCTSRRNARDAPSARWASDYYFCTWPETAFRVQRIMKLLEVSTGNDIELAYELGNGDDAKRKLASSHLQILRGLHTLFVNERRLWTERDPFLGPVDQAVEFLHRARVGLFECIREYTGFLWAPGTHTLKAHLTTLMSFHQDTERCKNVLKAAEYALPEPDNNSKPEHNYGETRLFLAGLSALPQSIQGKRMGTYTITELAAMVSRASEDLERSRDHVMGADLINLIDPLPQMPYALALWAMVWCTVLLSFAAAVALRADARLRATGVSEQDPNWLTVLLLPGAGSRTHAVFNHGVLLLPTMIGLAALWLWPPVYLEGIVAQIETSRGSDLPPGVQSFAVDVKGLVIPLRPFLYGVENRIIRSANEHFFASYVIVLALNFALWLVVIRHRRKVLDRVRAAAALSTAPRRDPSG